MKNEYKSLAIVLVSVIAAGALIFTLSGVVEAFDEFEIEEDPDVEEEPAPDQAEQIDPWMEEETAEEGLSAEEVVETSCEGIPAPEEVEDENTRALMELEIANLALNIEGEFFERPEACEELLEDWFED